MFSRAERESGKHARWRLARLTGHGGRVDVYSKDGVSYVSLNVEEDGGVVNTINKFGIEKNR